MKKIKVGVLGCTGSVGQKLVRLLSSHSLFEIAELAASESSAGKKYGDAVRWLEDEEIPEQIANLEVKLCTNDLKSKILFSALDSSVAGEIEAMLADKGYFVISNSKNHRMDTDVPLVIPEVNAFHFNLIHIQKKRRKGFIVTNPNCSTIVLSLALVPLYYRFGLKRVSVTTMQAISGAGYPGVPSLNILGNIIPYIEGEEEKIETEILKILGKMENDFVRFADFKVSASCNRVPVRDGHLLSISFETEQKATEEEILASIFEFNHKVQKESGNTVLYYIAEKGRPQPLLDINRSGGMAVTIGNLRRCAVLDWKFTALGHNTIRGAAGAAIKNAEYLLKLGLI
ncbi:MAG: aspartate-semialdehyde dehydrogenase [Ignavibacteria bacterium]